jgi:cysteine-rich repeat protein
METQRLQTKFPSRSYYRPMLLVVLAVAVLGAAPAAEAASPVFRQQMLLGSTGTSPANTSVAGHENTWLVAWDAVADAHGCGNDREILLARTDDHGEIWQQSAPLLGSDCALDDGASDTDPFLVHLGDTRWMLLWVSTYDPASGTALAAADSAILMSWSDDDGRTWSTPEAVTASRVGDGFTDAAPAAAISRSGRMVLAWQSNVRGNTDIWVASNDAGSVYDPTLLGSNWSAPELPGGPMVQVDTSGGGLSDREPAIATDDQGRWMLVWTRDTLGNGPSDVAVVVSSDDAHNWPVGNYGFTVSAEVVPAVDMAPSVATDGRGHWAVAWQTWRADDPVTHLALGPDPDIFVATVTFDPAAPLWWWGWTPRGAIAPHAPAAFPIDESPVLAVGADGDWAVAWTTRAQGTPADGDDDEVWIARVGNADTWPIDGPLPWHGAVALNSFAWHDGMDNDLAPALASDRRGRWMAAWPRSFIGAATYPQRIGVARGRELNSIGVGGAEILGTADPASRPALARGDVNCGPGLEDLGWGAVWDLADANGSAIMGSGSQDNGRTWSTAQAVIAGSDDHRRPDLGTGRCEWRMAWDSDQRYSTWFGPGTTDLGTDRDVLWSWGYAPDSMLDPGIPLQDNFAINFQGALGWPATDRADDSLVRVASVPDGIEPRRSGMCLAEATNGRRCSYDGQCGLGGSCLELEVRTLAVWEAREGDVCQGGLFDGIACVTDFECGGGICPASTVLFSHKFEYDTSAASWITPAPIDTTTSQRVTDIFPDVAGDGTGHWMAVWTRFEQPANDVPISNIVVARSGDNAGSWSAPLVIATGGDAGLDDVFAPRIATDTSGTWLVVWRRNNRIERSVSHDQGQTWSEPETILEQIYAVEELALASDRGGNWILAWGDSASRLHYAGSSDDGDSWSQAVALQESDAGAFDVASDANGAWLLAWRDDRRLRSPTNLILAAHGSCGNGVPEAGESCDDGNLALNDACDNTCRGAICGDRIVCDDPDCALARGGPGLETCDDGDLDDNDPCTNQCQTATCGDRIVCSGADCTTGPGAGPEQCDHGYSNSDVTPNACRTNCAIPTCGDSVVDDHYGEQCDEGSANQYAPDTCRPDCLVPRCGDSIPDPGRGEECDDGAYNLNEPNRCRANCVLPVCGDGIVDTARGEECDEGDFTDPTDDGSGFWCNSECRRNTCGNGDIEPGEQCDSSPGCTPWCVWDRQLSDCRNRFVGLLGRELERSASALGSCIAKVRKGRLDIPEQDCAEEPKTAAKLARGEQTLDRKLLDACGPPTEGAPFDAIAGVGACGSTVDAVSGGGCIDAALADSGRDLVATWFGDTTGPLSKAAERCQKKLSSAAEDLATVTFQTLAACRDQGEDSAACASGSGAAPLSQAGAKLRTQLASRCPAQAIAELGLCADTLDGLVGADGAGGCLVERQMQTLDVLLDAAVGR